MLSPLGVLAGKMKSQGGVPLAVQAPLLYPVQQVLGAIRVEYARVSALELRWGGVPRWGLGR